MYLLEGNEDDEDNADDGGNFFAGHNQWDWIKVAYILIHVLLTLLVPCLLYSICWYERYSPDLQYRAVSNILLSHSCWIGIIRSFLVRIPSVLVIVFGPFDPWTCNIIFSSARFENIKTICSKSFERDILNLNWSTSKINLKVNSKSFSEDMLVKLYLTLNTFL